jgi:hypothetical protein
MIVTLLTDFGGADHFVGVMKGVILKADPRISIVDLGHEIPPGDVREGAFALLASYKYFPSGTVHVAVVDPGVGSDRRPIVVDAGGQRFVGPDNGLLSYLLEREAGARAVWIRNEQFFLHPVSATFHGRDIFAPVGAALATGTDLDSLGSEVEDPLRLPSLRPRVAPDGSRVGTILHVDRFGNCVTSLTPDDVTDTDEGKVRLGVAGGAITALRRHYAGALPGEPFAILGSTGFLEISINGASAAAALGLKAGDPVTASPGAGAEAER